MSAQLHQQLANLSYAVRQQQQALGELKSELATSQAFNSAALQQPTKPLQIEDIPGLRTPKWYAVDIDFTLGDTAVRFNSAEISPDGPFVITQCAPWWRITDTAQANFFGNGTVAPTGRILPCTATPMLLNSGISSTIVNDPAGAVPPNAVGGIKGLFQGTQATGTLSDIPEFSFQIEIAGSGRFWTNLRVPAASFYGWGGQPSYTGIQGWVERTDRITIHATPEVTIPHNGTVTFIFEGYQILGPINLAQELSVSG
jgi:hypothetical protein